MARRDLTMRVVKPLIAVPKYKLNWLKLVLNCDGRSAYKDGQLKDECQQRIKRQLSQIIALFGKNGSSVMPVMKYQIPKFRNEKWQSYTFSKSGFEPKYVPQSQPFSCCRY
jgi:hypothetical protein